VSALLADDFTTDDLKLIAREFKDGELGHATSVLLNETVYHLKGLFETGRFTNDEGEDDELVDLVKRRRISKRAFTGLVNSIIPGFFASPHSTEDTMNDMVRRVIREASASELSRIISTLEGGSADQFLRGILNK
jgi:hypothetical protein